MLRRRLWLVPLLLALLATPIIGDQIFLKDGKRIDGTIIAEHADRIEVKLESGEVKTIPRSAIGMISKAKKSAGEYKKRLAALPKDDLDAHLDLAAWCAENKMRRQRTAVLKRALKIDKNCPEAQRALIKKWNGSKWVKDKAKRKVAAPQAASRAKLEKIGLTLTAPTGWQTKDGGDKGLTLTGPSRYREAVTLEIAPAEVDPASAFGDAEEKWTPAKDVTFGKLAGRVAERLHRRESRRLKTREYVVAGNGWMHRIRFTCLEVEFNDWLPHLDLVLRSIVVLAPKLDFKSTALDIGFAFPNISEWQVGELTNKEEKTSLGVIMIHQGDSALAFARIFYLVMDVSDDVAGNLDEGLSGQTSNADIKAKKDARLGPLKARLWESDTLQQGIPVFQINFLAVKGKKGHFFTFMCHEQSEKTFRPAFEKLCSSFVFGVK